MTLHHITVFIALLATAAMGVGCGISDGHSYDGNTDNAGSSGISIQGLSETNRVDACAMLTLNAQSSSTTDSTTEYNWNVTAPQNAQFDFTPDGSQFHFSGRTPGEYLVSATICNSPTTSAIDCAVTEFAVTVQLGADLNNNGIGDKCEAANCVPACEDRTCGLDPICQTSCGSCSGGQECDTAEGQCKALCIPACEGRTCGLDPICQTSCGSCANGSTCNSDGACEVTQKPGRVVTLVMNLTDRRLAFTDPLFHQRARLIQQSVRWVSPVDAPNVLVVQDDNSGSMTWDPQMVMSILKKTGIQAHIIQEPTKGLSPEQLKGFDVVWFSNPSQPVDDTQTIRVLQAFVHQGGGVILQGDDIAHGSEMSVLTRLQYVSDGDHYCGQYINDDRGASYEIKVQKANHPVISGLTDNGFYYGNDIDNTTVVSDPNAKVLAWASVKTCRSAQSASSSCPKQPVIVAYAPAQ